MNVRRLLIVGLAVALLAPAGLLAQARGGGGGALLKELLPPRGYLQLTEEQRDAVRALAEDLRPVLEPLRDERQTIAEQLREALNSDSPDATEVGQLVIDQHEIGGQIRDELSAFGDAFRELLDAEQQVKWDNFLELRRLARRQANR